MPNSPSVKFEFENRNVQQTTPMLGVSCVLARTTKGPYDDPSEIINSFSHFQRVFGSEIVPDGSVSNIEKAFMGGSKLRVIRVLGKGATKGVVSAAAARTAKAAKASEDGSPVPASATPEEASPASLFKFTGTRSYHYLQNCRQCKQHFSRLLGSECFCKEFRIHRTGYDRYGRRYQIME